LKGKVGKLLERKLEVLN